MSWILDEWEKNWIIYSVDLKETKMWNAEAGIELEFKKRPQDLSG